jgi:peptidylprolyl isomerase
MKLHLAIVLLCLALAPLACGGSEPATSASETDTSQGDKVQPEKESAPEKPAAVKPEAPKLGSYPHEGPFAAISGGKGNEKPHIDPSDQPAPKQLKTRELKLGTGPAARLGDEVGIYYAGAVYETGKVQYYGWPPAPPATFKLGFSAFGRSWEEGMAGMRVGGIREMVAPSSFFNGTGAVDYVIELVSLEPVSGPS